MCNDNVTTGLASGCMAKSATRQNKETASGAHRLHPIVQQKHGIGQWPLSVSVSSHQVKGYSGTRYERQ